jgi:ankyrin repeat domain-containing protein 50
MRDSPTFTSTDMGNLDASPLAAVLRTFLRQLCTTMGAQCQIPMSLKELYFQTKLKGEELAFRICKEQLLHLVNIYPQTTLILDALDECEVESRSQLVEAKPTSTS